MNFRKFSYRWIGEGLQLCNRVQLLSLHYQGVSPYDVDVENVKFIASEGQHDELIEVNWHRCARLRFTVILVCQISPPTSEGVDMTV